MRIKTKYMVMLVQIFVGCNRNILFILMTLSKYNAVTIVWSKFYIKKDKKLIIYLFAVCNDHN